MKPSRIGISEERDGLPRIVYAANRLIGFWCLQDLLAHGLRPVALAVADGSIADYAGEMQAMVPEIPLFKGRVFQGREESARLRELMPDLLISVHYPYLLPQEILQIPRFGCLNLHPAFLPYNRGWHTATWAIFDGTPYGATLHWIDRGVDTGPIALQRALEIRPNDTAHSLYSRVLQLERDLFREAIPLLRSGQLPTQAQPEGGTAHKKEDLTAIQNIDDWETKSARAVIDRLRALTTNRLDEAAYFTVGKFKYRVRVEIVPEIPTESR